MPNPNRPRMRLLSTGRHPNGRQTLSAERAVNSQAGAVDPATGLRPWPLDRSCLVSVCLRCGSVVMAADSQQRDWHAGNTDLSCCGEVVVFRTPQEVVADA